MLLRIVLALTLLLTLGNAAGAADTAFRLATPSSPDSDVWNEGFSIVFSLDEKQCRAAYGKDWLERCAAPMPGMTGRTADTVSMRPAVPGVWRWQAPHILRFHPETSLKPATRYEISLADLPLPAGMRLRATRLQYTTSPQAVRIGKETFWTDPAAGGRHAVSVPLYFIWPADTAQVEAALRVGSASPGSGLRFDQPRVIWNESRDEALVTATVATLPDSNVQGRVTLHGMYSFSLDGSKRVLRLQKPTESRFAVTGKKHLLDIRAAELSAAHDKDLNPVLQLEIRTSLRIRPSELLRRLSVVQLPARAQAGAGNDTDWAGMPAISPEDRARGTKLAPEPLEDGDHESDRLLFRLPAMENGRFLLIDVQKGLTAGNGLTLAEDRRFLLRAPDLSPTVALLQPGNVLSLSGDKKLNLYTVGLRRLEWQTYRVREPFLALLAQNASSASQFELWGMSPEQLGTLAEGVVPLPEPEKPGQAVFHSLELAQLLNAKDASLSGVFFLQIQGIDAEGKQRAFLNRLVLATSLGLTVKKTFDGKPATVFVQHLGTGLPLEGVQIQVLGSNGVSLVTGVTDAQGRAQLPPVEGLPRDVLPAAIVARSADGQDTAWLSLRDFARTVDYSDFPVAGRHVSPDGMIVSAFSQRDIYRPGERLHFGCILRKADGTPLPEGVPLEVELIDPRPATVLRRSLTTDRDGLFVLDWDSPADAITGPYRLSVRLAGDRPVFLGDVAVRVEEFQPDTLSIKANFSPAVPRGWFRTGSGETPTASVRLDNLYGQPAAGHRVSAAFQTAAGTFRFEEYSDYTFYDASPFNGESTSLRMSDATTDASGTALLPLPLGRLLPGTFRGTVQIEGFEPSGGRAVTRSLNALFSPQALALGWKPEGGANNLEYIPQHTAGSLRLLAVNNDLQPVAVEKAQLILSERRYVTSLVSDAQGRYRYDAASVDTEVQRSEAVIGPDGFLWSIPTETPGDYLLSVRDAEGTLLASIPFSIAGNRLAAPEELDPASLARGNLRLVLDKKRYAPGDVIKMRLSAPFDGSGLITIERDNVVAHAWFTAKAGESVQEITLPRDFEGAGYVNVSFVRSQQSDAIYMQPHAYAVAPFTAGVEQRDMGLRLEAPASVRPGEELRVRLSARTPGRAVVFAVDEGILQLTDFRTPDPLADILLNRALGVQTSRMFDLLMPDHARLRGRIPGFGGGVGVGARFLNPFQRRGEAPFAVWLDPVDVGPEGRELTIAVPESFTGKFRLMAVGCAAPSSPSVTAGNAETFVEVNGTIIVKPLLPSTVAPGDTFEGALAIANTVAGSGPEAQVQLTLKTGSGLELRDTPAEQTVVIPENGEKVIPLPLRALDEPGVTSVSVVATLGKEKPVQRSIELAIRPATPRTLTLSERVVDKQRDISAPSALYPYQAVTRATLSTGPLSALRAVFARLNAYPYDCTEQRISQAFPYAALSAVPELRASFLSQAGLAPEEKDKDAMGRRVAAAVQGIQRCFVVNDGVSFWPGGKADDFLTAYAADFLLTLRENGSIAPEPLTRNLLDALQRLAVRPPMSAHDARIKIYAVWVLLRDGRIMTQEVRELERWCRANLPDWERDAVATLLADSLAMLRLERQARDILPPRIAAPASDSVFTPAILHGLHALALSRHFPERRVDIPVDSLVRYAVTDASPLELSFLARGLLTLGGTPPPLPPDVRLTCTEVAPGFPPVTAEAVAEGSVLTLDAPGCTRVETSAPAGEGWRLQLLTDGYPRTPQPEKAQGLEVRRRFLDERGEAVLSAPVGALLTVEITLRSDNTTLENIVITDLLPGGLELLLEKDDSLPQGDGLLYRQRREDRSLFFVNATPAAATYRYRVRAATRGTFALPPVSAEAMYDAATRAAADGGQFVVE